MKPFFFATQYWELHWLYPIIKATKWPVLVQGNEAKSFCEYNKFEMITEDEARQNKKLVTCLAHFGEHQKIIREWIDSGKQVYLVQRAFDSALSINDEFWSMDMSL